MTPREQLVLANRILAMESLIGPFGHVSLRTGPETFLINKHDAAGAWIESADLSEIDTGVTRESVRQQKLFSEIFLHSTTYQAFAEVGAVAHTHSPHAIALSTLTFDDDRVVPTTNPGSNLGNFIPIFSTVGLIQTPEQARSVLHALQGQNGVLLRGHGALIVGTSVEQAVLRAIYLEYEARIQLISRAAGEPKAYRVEESDQFKVTRAIDHPWDYYVEKLRQLDKAARP